MSAIQAERRFRPSPEKKAFKGGIRIAQGNTLQLSSSLGFGQWVALAGAMLLLLSLCSSYVQRMPISSSTLYLAIGILLGPRALGWVELRLGQGGLWFERLTEVAVVVALFISGLKLRLPPRHAAWAAVYRLAGPVMVLCIGSIALFGRVGLGLGWPDALLLGAVLAPTDPVLAGAVSVSDAADRDRVKYALSGEAGLNDGTAFPFVVLALAWRRHEAGDGGADWLLEWALLDLVWAVTVGLAVGYLLGRTLGRWAIHQRTNQRDTEAPSDFAALSLIALACTAATFLHAWSFLAAFAAGVGLRRAEVGTVRSSPHPEHALPKKHPPAEHLVSARVDAEELDAPAVAVGVLVAETMSFGSTVERILEVMLVTLVGVAVGSYWDSRALLLAPFLFILVRPLFSYVLLMGTKTSRLQRALIGWFGIRGIGSLYYLAYAQNHGLGAEAGVKLAGLTLSVITLSILAHGSSATPLLSFYARRKAAKPSPRRRPPDVALR